MNRSIFLTRPHGHEVWLIFRGALTSGSLFGVRMLFLPVLDHLCGREFKVLPAQFAQDPGGPQRVLHIAMSLRYSEYDPLGGELFS